MAKKNKELVRILIAAGASLAALVVISIIGVAVMLNFDALCDVAAGSGFASANRAYGKMSVGMDRHDCLAALEEIPGLIRDHSTSKRDENGNFESLEETYAFTIGETRDCSITLKFDPVMTRDSLLTNRLVVDKLILKSKYKSGF